MSETVSAMWTCLAHLVLEQIYAQTWHELAIRVFKNQSKDLQSLFAVIFLVQTLQICKINHLQVDTLHGSEHTNLGALSKPKTFWRHGIYQLFPQCIQRLQGKIEKIEFPQLSVNFRKVDSPKSKTTRLAPTQLTTGTGFKRKRQSQQGWQHGIRAILHAEIFIDVLNRHATLLLRNSFYRNFQFWKPACAASAGCHWPTTKGKNGFMPFASGAPNPPPNMHGRTPAPAFLRFFIPRFIRNAKLWGSNSGNKYVPLLDLVHTIRKTFSQEMCGAPANKARKIPTKYTIVQTSFMYILIPVLCNLISHFPDQDSLHRDLEGHTFGEELRLWFRQCCRGGSFRTCVLQHREVSGQPWNNRTY